METPGVFPDVDFLKKILRLFPACGNPELCIEFFF